MVEAVMEILAEEVQVVRTVQQTHIHQEAHQQAVHMAVAVAARAPPA
jgi:hypothetical protein